MLVSSGNSRFQCCFIVHRCFLLGSPDFLHHWGSLTCSPLLYLGFLPGPLVSSSLPSTTCSPWLDSFLMTKSGSLSGEPHRVHRNSGTLRVQAVPIAAFSPLLSSQGASHLEYVFRRLGVSQTSVPVSLQLRRMCHVLQKVFLKCPLIWHEVKRKHPHPPLLGEKGNVQHTDNCFQRNALTFSYPARRRLPG